MHAACCCTAAGDRRPVLFTPVCHRPAGNPTPNLPIIAMECWDCSMSTCSLAAWLSVFSLPASSLHLYSLPSPFFLSSMHPSLGLSGLDCKLLEGRDRVFSPFPCIAPARTSTYVFKKS